MPLRLSSNFRRLEIWLVSAWLLAVAAAGYWVWSARQVPEGPYESISLRLNAAAQSACDLGAAGNRLAISRLIDRFRPGIQALWAGIQAEEFPESKMQQVGPIFVRLSEVAGPRSGFESSVWSWEDASGIYLRTQSDPHSPETKQRWRDLETATKFLLERDIGRLLRGRKYLDPENTEHTFQPNRSVSREGEAFVVRLDPGEFKGAEAILAKIFARAWGHSGRQVKIRWVKGDPEAYRMEANFRSSRSFVNHRTKTLAIANFAWANTIAHELGHVLGFDDHYYTVWNDRNCYYTQKARLSDLMSDSQGGRITAEHWYILDMAYPKGSSGAQKPFPYFFRENK